MFTPKDAVAFTQPVYQTVNYKQFKILEGNRPIDEAHVKSLARKMVDKGNLMPNDPVRVNERFEITDGQHRIKAAEITKQPVYYVVQDGSNIDTVISFNTGNKNWTWLNYAQSWASRGNKQYAEFLKLYEKYHYTANVLLTYALITNGSDRTHESGPLQDFKAGEFVFKDLELTKQLLAQYAEVTDAAGWHNREFAQAMFSFMRRPNYDQQRLLRNVSKYGDGLTRCYTVTDYQIELENIYKA